ncbi:MAG: hypothetical protein BWY88_01308 [Synergistetes bacterium ADurb.Bin520]|nr:MAG: hypothetical protein BWY88_01308 [Synergistetes bacterium ADurb.Bin520]
MSNRRTDRSWAARIIRSTKRGRQRRLEITSSWVTLCRGRRRGKAPDSSAAPPIWAENSTWARSTPRDFSTLPRAPRSGYPATTAPEGAKQTT